MKITKLDVQSVLVPMPPHRTASGVVSASPLVLLRLDTDAGVSGSSIIFTYTPAAQKPCAELLSNCESLIKGVEVAPATIWETLQKRFRLLGTQGLVGMVLAAIDMAAWDALARHRDLPLYQ